MLYITGQHALNLPCKLLTCGDWHTSALQWERPCMRDSADSIFGDYGIERGIRIPEHEETYAAANHIRALLDLLEMGKLTVAQGMNRDFICNDAYTPEVFEQVSRLRSSEHWQKIDRFMGKEYAGKWLDYKEGLGS
jgi:hypothetical protein